MAGDIGIDEHVIVIPSHSSIMASEVAINAHRAGARVIHQYGPRVMISELAPNSMDRVRAAIPTAEVVADLNDLSASATTDLDPIGALGLAAFNLRQSAQYIAAKQQRPHQGVPWDSSTGQLLPPDPPPHLQHLTRSPALGEVLGLSGTTSQRMTGKIAVGIIIVSGPHLPLPPNYFQFTPEEVQHIIAEVQHGLGWHAAQNPAANITWVYDIHRVQVGVFPHDDVDKEALWRDPAMVQMGYQGNWQGVIDYINYIKTHNSTDWTYVAYFTKYPLDWFAYASFGGPRLVMQYSNDSWGPDNIDRVFAHETGHIFQAPDEYSESNCNCGGSYGIYNRQNGNCERCSSAVACIMRSNSWAYCNWTPWHYGFPWPNGFPVYNATSAAPTACVFDQLYLFWKGNDPRNEMYFSASSDGQTWPPGQVTNAVDSTSAAPAACVFNSQLYLFWKANDSSNAVFFSASPDGQTWPPGQSINTIGSIASMPAPCVFNNLLYVFWKEDLNYISFSASSDGQSWPAKQHINPGDSTSAAPAACVFKKQLYLFWKATDWSNAIFFSASLDGTTWPPGHVINNVDSTADALAACVFNEQLYVFWKANNSSNAIFFSASSDGQTWPAGRPVNPVDSTAASIATALFRDNLYLFWQDLSSEIIYSP